jgi:hypothetical protein
MMRFSRASQIACLFFLSVSRLALNAGLSPQVATAAAPQAPTREVLQTLVGEYETEKRE